MTDGTALEIGTVTRRYGAVTAVTDVSLRLEDGRVMALVGENGAGKSTLARIIAGVETADSGTINVSGPVAFVPQHPALAPSLSILDNLTVGFEPTRGLFISRSAARARFSHVADRLDLPVNLDLRAGTATAGELRFAVLLAQVARDPCVIVLDEPAVGLDARDRERIESAIATLAAEGAAILLISHDLEEVERLASRVTVLREGAVVASFDAPFDRREIAESMFAHAPEPRQRPMSGTATPPNGDDVRLVMEGLTALSPETGERVGPLDITVRAGERIALCGLREDGIEMIEALLSGELLTTSGTLLVNNQRLPARLSPDTLRTAGLSYVPSDRLLRGATLRGSVEENLTLHERRRLHRGGFLRVGKSASFSNSLLSRFRVVGNRAARLASLSGGNIQRVILSRELAWNPAVVVIAEPAAGLDIDGQHQLADRLATLAGEGTAVVTLGSDLREAELFADRVVVLRRGSITGTFDATDDAAIVGAMMGVPR